MFEERFESRDPRREMGADAAAARRVCKDCHGAPGVYSLNSYLPFRLLAPSGTTPVATPAQLSEIPFEEAARTAIAAKQQRADWRVLQPLLRR